MLPLFRDIAGCVDPNETAGLIPIVVASAGLAGDGANFTGLVFSLQISFKTIRQLTEDLAAPKMLNAGEACLLKREELELTPFSAVLPSTFGCVTD